jgi:hypothetical protein
MAHQLNSVEVSIAAHYVPQRAGYLAQSLDTINQWTIGEVSVTIGTNDGALQRDPTLANVLERLRRSGRKVSFEVAHGLAHPWHLTWWHKQRLREWAESADEGDLFCYMEDDIALPDQALAYFWEFLPAAKEQGVIPGFLRYEKNRNGRNVSTDFRGHQAVAKKEILELEGQRFVAPDYPYWAGFILDKELAEEYLASPWADLNLADQQPQSNGHSCRVQSAWALTYNDVPPGLPSRLVVPVGESLTPLDDCLVWHTPNNYAASKVHGFGTVPIDKVFLPAGLLAAFRQVSWNVSDQFRRLKAKVARIFGTGE